MILPPILQSRLLVQHGASLEAVLSQAVQWEIVCPETSQLLYAMMEQDLPAWEGLFRFIQPFTPAGHLLGQTACLLAIEDTEGESVASIGKDASSDQDTFDAFLLSPLGEELAAFQVEATEPPWAMEEPLASGIWVGPYLTESLSANLLAMFPTFQIRLSNGLQCQLEVDSEAETVMLDLSTMMDAAPQAQWLALGLGLAWAMREIGP
jgi:hypothetical protein